jgi:hypothetical protein
MAPQAEKTVIFIRMICRVALIAQLSLTACTASADPCEDKEWWFEVGIGFYSNGYSLEGTEKRTRSLYKTQKGRALTEDEAVATALQAWRFLHDGNVSTNIGQVERLILADQYYNRCREIATMN